VSAKLSENIKANSFEKDTKVNDKIIYLTIIIDLILI
jgi:hypothetical protein